MTTALITGGTSGIGAAFARALAGRGDDLVLVARDADRLARTASTLTETFGVSVETVSADLSDRGDVQRVAERIASAERPIDILVNNAGFGVRTRLVAEDLSPYDAAIDVMVRAVLVLAGTAGRVMSARGTGTIINVSSTAGFTTMGGYSAIKTWATAYTEALASQLRGTGVTVTALCPGWVRTEFHQRAAIDSSKIPDPMWVDVDEVVEGCLADVAKGKVISIPTGRYKGLIFLARHAPRGAIRAVSRKLSSGRH